MKRRPQRCKILASLGPASAGPALMRQLVSAGVDAFRINSAHSTHADIVALARKVRRVAHRLQRPICVIQDLAGPKIRCGTLPNDQIEIRTADLVTLQPRKESDTPSIIPVDCPALFKDLAPRKTILLADGTVCLRVQTASAEEAVCRVVQGGTLRSRQGVNLPDLEFSGGAVTQADEAAIRSALEAGVDYVSVSFVQTRRDILRVRELLGKEPGAPGIIAKIERPQAVDELDAILTVADGIMVARGDLGIEMDIARIPAIQKRIIRRARAKGRFVITATQMLESMTRETYPTRAEATDVANAVWDGSDALMLSGETAIGRHPVRVARMMTRIVAEAEREETYRGEDLKKNAPVTALAHAAVDAAVDIRARAILVFTHSGVTAARMSQRRPPLPVFAAVPTEQVARSLAIRWGVEPFVLPPQKDSADQIGAAEKTLLARKWCRKGDRLVLVTGSQPLRGLDYTVKIMLAGSTDSARFHDSLTEKDLLP
ncbi:MAG: pyruvate kinase [Kiritimatiellae bacterium]|nr:pyruvate kinase [Kiritimatiellia bacterium]